MKDREADGWNKRNSLLIKGNKARQRNPKHENFKAGQKSTSVPAAFGELVSKDNAEHPSLSFMTNYASHQVSVLLFQAPELLLNHFPF